MNKNVIKTIILERQESTAAVQVYERQHSFDDHTSYVLIGIRRAGKSFMLYQDAQQRVSRGLMTWDDCLFVNFEDERLASIKAEELGDILTCYKEMYPQRTPQIYLDEIQNVEGWEKFARRLADSGYRVMVTGSNAKMLSNEIATTLGGRYVVREVFPFSFGEYVGWSGVELDSNWCYSPSKQTEVVRLMETYLRYGGFAEAFSKQDKREWVNSLYLTVLSRDIITRNAVRNGMAIRLLCRKLAESVMQPTTNARLTHVIKSAGISVSRNTLAEYLEMLRDAYLVFEVGNYVSSLSERASECKRYFCDNALLNNFLTQCEPQLLENVVAIDLIHRYRNTANDGVYFYNRNIEVDFFVPNEGLAVQVSYSLDAYTTREREVRALVALNAFLHLKRAVIVTYDEEAQIDADGLAIEVVPIWKWLIGH